MRDDGRGRQETAANSCGSHGCTGLRRTLGMSTRAAESSATSPRLTAVPRADRSVALIRPSDEADRFGCSAAIWRNARSTWRGVSSARRAVPNSRRATSSGRSARSRPSTRTCRPRRSDEHAAIRPRHRRQARRSLRLRCPGRHAQRSPQAGCPSELRELAAQSSRIVCTRCCTRPCTPACAVAAGGAALAGRGPRPGSRDPSAGRGARCADSRGAQRRPAASTGPSTSTPAPSRSCGPWSDPRWRAADGARRTAAWCSRTRTAHGCTPDSWSGVPPSRAEGDGRRCRPCRFHDLRHASGVAHVRGGCPLTVSEQAPRAQPVGSRIDTYSHLVVSGLAAAPATADLVHRSSPRRSLSGSLA